MKKKIFTAMLAVMVILSACSGDGNSTSSTEEASVSSLDASTQAETEPVVSDAESSEADISSKDEAVADAEEFKTVRIDADGGLRMRGGPDTDYDIIKIIPQNEYAELAKGEGTHTDWLYVYYDGDYGWVSAEFVVYEEKLPPIQVSDWAQIYYDYLNGLELTRHSDVCDYDWCDDDWTVFKVKFIDGIDSAIYRVEFQRFPGYDYPIMVCFVSFLKGHAGGVEQIMPIENGTVATGLDWLDSRRDTFFHFDNEEGWPELKGESVKIFDYRDDASLTQALSWLKEQM